MEHLSTERLEKFLEYPLRPEDRPSVHEIRIMARVCLNHHPDRFMEGFEQTPWPEVKGEASHL